MQRLLEREARTASITSWAPSARDNTQASNFCLCKRSAALLVMMTVSTLNCLKHSAMSAQVAGSMPTNAARAAVFRPMGREAKVALKALSMIKGKTPLSKIIVERAPTPDNAPKGQPAKGNGSLLFQGLCERGHYELKSGVE